MDENRTIRHGAKGTKKRPRPSMPPPEKSKREIVRPEASKQLPSIKKKAPVLGV